MSAVGCRLDWQTDGQTGVYTCVRTYGLRSFTHYKYAILQHHTEPAEASYDHRPGSWAALARETAGGDAHELGEHAE